MGRILRGLAAVAILTALSVPFTTIAIVPPGVAGATRSTMTVEPLCAPAQPGYAQCLALRRTDIAPLAASAVTPMTLPSGFGPADLASAYALPGGTAGSGLTVAIIDAYDLPTAEADLTVYRAQYGLPACTTANGCFKKIDQNGGTSYPAPDAGWGGEIALDIDMVSATCPNCKILLVEATTASIVNLGTAVNTAVALGAVAVSNSYSGLEASGETAYDTAYYNHPGVAITASTGDDGYDVTPVGSNLYIGVGYPAASPYVVAVGGTSLVRDGSTRGWSESAWGDLVHQIGAGSGCSLYEAKPSWQHDASCAKRMQADVSAVADPYTGVAVYDSYGGGGWSVIGGTSASSPIIASVFAMAGTPAPGAYPASYLYDDTADLNDVTTGSNDIWEPQVVCSITYYCNGVAGYDGPTGLGTPNGTRAFGPLGPTVPDAPTGVIAARGNASASVSWGAPASHGSAITGYTVTSSPDGRTCTWTSGPLSCTVTTLTNGTPYTFSVTATNGVGTGPASAASNSVTPAAVPGKPTGVTATAGNAAAAVSWAAPSSNGGSSITGYTVTSSPGGKTCTGGASATSCTVSGLTNGQAYTFTVHATNGLGDGPESDPSVSVTPVAPPTGATYHAITPTRVLDTRNGTGGLTGPFTNHAARTFTVAGVPAGAIAVTGNLTVTGQTSSGYLFIGPVATNNPGSSTLNFPVGDDRANAVTVALGAGGSLSITFVASSNGPSAHAIFDVTGYFTPDTTGATYHALSPSRALDTRNGTGGLSGPFTNHAARTFTLAGVPAGAIAVTGNLTVTGQSSSGYLFIGPVATDNPGSSTLNFPVADDRANAVTVALGAGGSLSITFVAPSNGPSAHAIFDVTGYFTPDMTGATFVPLTPSRVLDTRNGTGGLAGPFTNHAARTFTVAGVPAGAIAVTGNLTVTGQTSSGYLFIGPVATNNPGSSTLNFPVGDDRANAVTVALGGGTLSITFVAPSNGPSAHAIFDVTGYFTPAGA